MRYLILTNENNEPNFENFIELEKFDRSIPAGALIEEGCKDFKVGDTVACRKGHNLEKNWDGLNRPREEQTEKTYPFGVCVSVEPFVIVSADGTGIWMKKNPDHYYSLNTRRFVNASVALDTWDKVQDLRKDLLCPSGTD
jgi:hypothetical protein